ncbi:hypothetical protein FQR65_LT02824 [Abscondita terminalis]|nr:hypothetical protein FQR65_LT02824 [Abscondita terminalis]
MGNANSVDIPGGGTEGYHVLRVQENSPGSKAGLQAFFDFIIAINGTRLDQDNETLRQVLNDGIGKRVPLTVFSSKTQSVRSVTIEPSNDWGGQGLLGVSIRFCSFEGANENVWHVLEVHPSSPAEIAGLRSFSDYIISADSVLHENEDLFALIEAHEARSLKLYVYNSTDDCCREVTITPHRDWGGEGSLGCGIGYGYLHRIPIRSPTVVKPSHPQTSTYDNLLKSDASPNISNLPITTTNTLNLVGPSLVTPQPVASIPQYSVPSQMYTNPTASVTQIPVPSSMPPSSAIFNNPVTATNFVNVTYPMSLPSSTVSVPTYSPHQTESLLSHYSQTSSVNTVYSTPSPLSTVPTASNYFNSPVTTNNSVYSMIPPLNSQTATSVIFDPTIAAQSAQQLLSNSNTPKQLNMFLICPKKKSWNVPNFLGTTTKSKSAVKEKPEVDEEVKRRSGLVGVTSDINKSDFSEIQIPKHEKKKTDEDLIKKAIAENEFLNQVLEGKRLEEVVDAMYKREVQAKEVVIKEGSIGTQLYISVEGKFDISIKENSVGTFDDVRVFGELAILYNAKRQATITALTNGQIWVLEQNIYQQLTLKTEVEQRNDLLAFLKDVPQLNTVSIDILNIVADLLKKEFFETGQTIVKEGETGDKFFLVGAGTVNVSKQSEGEVGSMVRGQFFGQLALLNDDVRKATVTANAPGVECYTLTRPEFVQHLGNIEDIQNAIITTERKSTQTSINPYQDIQLKDLIVLTTLGIGGFGRVELVRHKNKKELVFALKCLKKAEMTAEDQKQHVKNEKNNQMSCNSPFIVRMYKTMTNNKYIYFLMETCLGGDLWLLLQKQKGRRFDESTARFYSASALEALVYLHNRNIVYRDLKPENLLLDSKGYLKLTDFGFAKELDPSSRTYTFAGTPEYVAPEIVLNRGHGKAVDYWALGILIYELLVGRTPFRTNDTSYIKTYNLILRGIENIQIPDYVPRRAEHLIRQLCKPIPKDRLRSSREGIQQIRDERWFLGFSWDQLRAGRLRPPIKRNLNGTTDTRYFETFEKDTDNPPDVPDWEKDFEL